MASAREQPDQGPTRLGRRMARFNRSVTNHLTVHVAGHLPYLGIVVHTGRRTGRRYRTPVNVFAWEDGYRIALTYGRDSEWVRNALAAGGVGLITHGHEHRLVDPRVVRDPERRAVPWPARSILGGLRVSDFLELRDAAPVPAPGA